MKRYIRNIHKVASMGRPLRMQKEGNGQVVLLIHGYTGLCSSFQYLAEQLFACGYDVSCPRLPGHGTSSVDFRSSQAEDWLRKIVEVYQDLQEDYLVVGVSMGGLLASILAGIFPVQKLVLLAPALTVHNKLLYLSPVLRFLVRRICNNGKSEDYDSFLLHGISETQYAELEYLCRRLLPKPCYYSPKRMLRYPLRYSVW